MFTRCIESALIESAGDIEIRREVDRKQDPDTFQLYGPRTVFYAVYIRGELIESYKTLKEARKGAAEMAGII